MLTHYWPRGLEPKRAQSDQTPRRVRVRTSLLAGWYQFSAARSWDSRVLLQRWKGVCSGCLRRFPTWQKDARFIYLAGRVARIFRALSVFLLAGRRHLIYTKVTK